MSEAPEKKKGGIGKWILLGGIGCVIMVGLVVGLCVGLGAMGVSALKNTVPYQHALKTVKNNAEVKEALGEPITDGFPSKAEFSEDAATGGKANIEFPISGPKGKGTVYVTASKYGGEWHYSMLSVEFSGGASGTVHLGDNAK